MPASTTEGMPIRETPETDLRVGVSPTVFNLREWLTTAKRLPDQGRRTEYSVSAAQFSGHNVVIAVRLANARGRDAGWSNFVALAVTPPVPKPEHLSAEATADGVRLTWQSTGATLFRVYRRSAGAAAGKPTDAAFAPLGDAHEDSYLDRTAEFGTAYSYYVQGLSAGDKPSESEPSETVSITPKDVFPPATPSDLQTVAGTASIELSWSRNVEPDFAAYRVFRAEGDAPFRAIATQVTTPSYSDHDVKAGVRYRYQISAVDTTGNESPRSQAVEAALP